MSLGWVNTSRIGHAGWVCGYCGKTVGGDVGYTREQYAGGGKNIYICPHCENPTAFIRDEYGDVRQYPGAVYGGDVDGLPASVATLYAEVRRCVQYTAYTAAVLAMRKLLMHVAVEKGAPKNGSFVSYVDYLSNKGWIPPNGRDWVDAIRKGGNEAAHEIAPMGEDDAKQLLDFTEMLLRIVYEFPARLRR